jgi:hypothetical protein
MSGNNGAMRYLTHSIRQVRVLIGYVVLMSGGVRGYRHDQVGVEGCGDPLEQGDGGDDTACLQTGKRGLGHASPVGEFDL